MILHYWCENCMSESHKWLEISKELFVVFICSRNELISQMWPEGAQSVNSVTKRPMTAGVMFKTSIIQLVEKNLALKVRKLLLSLH